MDNQKITVFKSLFWKFSERILSQLVSSVIAIVLARLLSPDEYGTISLVLVFIAIANVLMTAGINTSLIQKKDTDSVDFSSAFYFSIVFSALIYGILFFISPFIANFYGIPTLCPVLRWLSLSVPITAINSIQQAYVSRHMLFQRFFLSTLISTILSGLLGIAMAYAGFGVYALVAQNLFSILTATVILWFTIPWKPTLEFSWQRIRILFQYGWKLLVQGIILNIYSSLRSLIIGKVYTTSDLAYYNKGIQYPNLIATTIDTTINNVLFPAIAKEQNDLEKVKSMTRRTTRLCSYVMSPVLIGFMVVAEPFIRLLLTDKWIPAIPFLQIICIVLLFLPPQTAILQAIKAIGRSDIVLKIDIPIRILSTLVLLIAIRFGVLYVAISEIITTILGTIIYIFASKKTIQYSYRDVMVDFLPNTALSACMGIFIWLVGKLLHLSLIIELVIQVLLGVGLYIGLSVLLKNECFTYIIAEVKGWLHARKTRE